MIRWCDVVGFEGLYQVSDCGKIRSYRRIVIRSNGRKYTVNHKILNPALDHAGYLRTVLSVDGKGKTIKIHREIAKAFINNPENKATVNHIDGNKINNHISNLEWATQKENLKHSFETGLQDNSKRLLIARNRAKRKINILDVPEIKNRFISGESLALISKDYSVDRKTIYSIVHGYTYK